MSQGKLERGNWFFCLQKNIQGFFKLTLSFLECVARHVQITQNIKYAVSLQWFKKKLSDEVDFSHADKHESFLQIDTKILIEMIKHFQSSQNSKFAMSLHYLLKEVRDGVHFCMQINIKVGIIVFDGSGQTCPNYPK